MDDFENVTAVSSDSKETIQAVAMCVISSTGLILNIIVVIMIIVLGEYKKTSHWYVLNLAIADGVFLLFLPLAAIEKISGEWKFGKGLCIIFTAAFYMNYYASIFFLTVMSFDRYVAIVFPMSPAWRKLRSRLGSAIITIIVWSIAFVASLPLLHHTKLINLDDYSEWLISKPNVTSYKCGLNFHDDNILEHQCIKAEIPMEDCTQNRLNELDYSSESSSTYEPTNDYTDLDMVEFSFGFGNETREEVDEYCQHKPYPIYVGWIYANIIVAYILPLLIIVFCYGCILWRILHPKIKRAQLSLQKERGKSFLRRRFSSTSSQQKRNHRATVLVVSLVAAFLVCWSPFQIINVLKLWRLSDDTNVCQVSVKVANFFAYSSSLLNPLLYTFLGAHFGKRFTRVWNKIRGRRRDRPVFRRTSRSNGRASMTSKSTKSVTESANFQHINMQLLPPLHKREPSMS